VSASLIGIATWSLFQISSVGRRVKRFLYSFLPEGRNLVINSKTGVIHHKEICSDHLPEPGNTASTAHLVANSQFHLTKKVQILDRVAEGVSAEDAVEILMLSAENNLTSVHIYDKLVKLLGKLKRYESIHLLLESAENELDNNLSRLKQGTKKYKKYEKALNHIKTQREKVLQRARLAALKF